MNNNHALESEAEGTPSKEREIPKGVKEASASPFSYKTLVWIIIIALFLAVVFLLLSSINGQRCLTSPFKFAAKQVSTSLSGEVFCSCTFTDPKYAPFFFTKDNLTIGLPR